MVQTVIFAALSKPRPICTTYKIERDNITHGKGIPVIVGARVNGWGHNKHIAKFILNTKYYFFRFFVPRALLIDPALVRGTAPPRASCFTRPRVAFD